MKISPKEPCPCGSGQSFKDCHGPKVRKKQELRIERRLALTVIPEPDPNTRSVFQLSGTGTVFIQGIDGPDTLECGRCGAELAIGINASQVRGIVLQCNRCKSFNDTPPKGF
jgi:SEC-C motif